ncbi:hypothetical protein WDU94_006588 [Cyamophila willieti]
MESPEQIISGVKAVPHSDLRGGTSRDCGLQRKEEENTKTKNKPGRYATWNVQTLLQNSKLENLKMEMTKMDLDVLGIAEMRWADGGDFWSGEYRIIHSGTIENKPGQGGVGIILKKDLGKRVKGYVHRKGRVILVKLDTHPVNTTIIQVYMPTALHEDRYVEEIYDEIQTLLDQTNGDENVILMGDFNARVGRGEDLPYVGQYGLGERNERGDRLVEFCAKNKFVITNTWFKHHNRRIYTYKSPGDRYRTQIDYIIVRERYRNQIKDSRSYAGPDIASDHNMVMAKGILKFKNLKKKNTKKWDMKLLKEDARKKNYERKTEECEINMSDNVHNNWTEIKNTIKKAADETVKREKPNPRKEWITEEILVMIEERRKFKNDRTEDGQTKYKALRNKINRESRLAKESFLQEKCKTINQFIHENKMESAYGLAKNFFGEQKMKSNTIEDENGKLLFESEKIASRWQTYLEALYDGERTFNDHDIIEDMDTENNEQQITRKEFDDALKKLKDNKSPGTDEIPAELIKNAGNRTKDCLYHVICQIYEEGNILEDFAKCKICVIPKKTGTTKCNEHRTLSLLSHASKILTNILINRIEDKIEVTLSDDQFGFRKGRGTRDAILSLRMLLEKRLKKNLNTYIAFIDLEKAFDQVEWTTLFEILKEIGIRYKDRRVIWNLYKNESAVFECNENTTEARIRQGVRQGCCLSPVLFNCYIQKALDEVRTEMSEWPGIKVEGIKVDMIRYADDIALTAQSVDELKETLEKMKDILNRKYNMRINKNKTKIMIVSKNEEQVRIILDDVELKQVKEFTYLGGKITQDGRCSREIASRIQQAKIAFNKKSKIFESTNINLEVRKNLIKSFVWSVLLYGCETWTISEKDKKHLEAFEMWCFRRTLKITWCDKITNEEVLRRIREKRQVLKNIQVRRATWIGHILRHEGLLHTLIETTIEGRNQRGRPRQEYLEDLKKDMGCRTYEELKEITEDRIIWRRKAQLLGDEHNAVANQS